MSGAFPEMIPPTIAAIEAAVVAAEARSNHDRLHPRLSASSLGEECEAKLWHSFRWTHEQEQFEGRLLRLFETGNVYEERLVGLLRLAGVKVDAVDPETGEQFRVVFADGHASGRTDGEAVGLPEAPKTRHLLECKTHSDKSFAELVKHGVEVAKPVHYAQMQIYMHMRGLTRALYLAVNKNTDALHAERIEYDPTAALRLVAKAERIVKADRPPTRQYDDPEARSAWKCRSCPALGVCHQGAWARRNCRTCLHSTPGPNGSWTCARFGRELSDYEQATGCERHLYLPELVPGVQEDATGADHIDAVVYRMADGSRWVDGEGAT